MIVMLFAAKVWHYWIGFTLWFGALATVLGLVIGYLVKVQRPQYPRRGQRPE
jgi:formate-dependent nitrite reductase membrane component NrfD